MIVFLDFFDKTDHSGPKRVPSVLIQSGVLFARIISFISMMDDLFRVCTGPRKNDRISFCTGVRIDLAQ